MFSLRTTLFTIFYLHTIAVNAIFDVDSNSLEEIITCASATGTIAHVTDNADPDFEENSTERTIRCKTNHCYSFWKEDANGTVSIMGQGCWETSGKAQDCDRSQCISDKKPPKAMNTTKFCCCAGDMCNRNFTDVYIPQEETSSPPTIVTEGAPKVNMSPLLWTAFGISFVLLMVGVGALMCFCWRMKPNKHNVETGQVPLPPPEEYSIDKLKLCSMIGHGRYGSVWRGLVDDQQVAVKVFPPHHRNYFLNEHELYKISGESSSVLKCFGGGERAQSPNGLSDYILIFNLEQECLQEYLKNHTINLTVLCRMSLGIAKGLAHLHSDLGKPCIAHRDINTRNVLVRADLSCCICDLGLAVVPRRTENHSLSEAGTLRYMAPEVLEGAVNLRDCESALKQIDVYSLGLVLWELGTRCIDMQACEPQPYAPPFYKEVGENPSLEQMQALVSRRKARPLWPPSWRDTVAARLLCETAEDCWDQDAEARLTSLCVEERLLELPTLRGRVLHPMHPPASPTPLINNNHLHDHTIDSSVGTIETLLSPSEENCKNSNQLAVCVTPLQPYQGRNPCLERNLLSGSSDCLLIDKSSKHCTSSDSQNLITNDFLNFQLNHRAVPIPYVQNAVHGSPKRYNGNVIVPPKTKFKWLDFKKLFHSKKDQANSADLASRKETKVQIIPGKLVNSFGQNGVTTTLINENETKRPSTLPLSVVQVDQHENGVCNTSGVTHLLKCKDSLSRQRSLEQFNEVFSSVTDLTKLKDPSVRVKTPGDVPPSVRRTRGKAANNSARFSLYDDRIMSMGQWGSAPDLDPAPTHVAIPQQDSQDRESISSF
ncbi:hypothetical protein PPYR_00249 [Photinus pyralis]|uniref:Serine/threonine-protein kinase receptor n=1 Tax=Photinus pyralis TaxID=7054 RepID=A0A1Y1LG84_PHOPY|nr:activin receptor type-2A [Photinus pyralis]XP_031347606.1 activin receptor type-2A [Photinus pyralis]KAB0803279.1 hypothetical protein PPYR_00249 [Photinus pyralis]